jgi:adenylosuccinate lyase
VYPKTIEAALAAELPFMATEEILMAAVQAGEDRQAVHEKIRAASIESAKKIKFEGKSNDLLMRLSANPAFSGVNFSQVVDANKFTGRAAEQTTIFLKNRLRPPLEKYHDVLSSGAELHI